MKRAPLITLGVSLAIVIANLFFLAGVQNLPSAASIPPAISQAMCRGHFERIFGLPALWKSFPAFPPASSLFSPSVLLIVGPAGCVAYFILRMKMKIRRLFVGWILAVGFTVIPYVIGLVALRNNDKLDATGYWLAIDTYSILYAMLACASFALIELIPRRSRANDPSIYQNRRIIELPL